MKKFIPKFIIVLILIAAIVLRYNYVSNKYRELTYAVNQRVTKGLFNSYKLYNIKDLKLNFSDGKVALVDVSGMQIKSPHKTVTYKLYLERDNRGLWHVKKFYAS